MQTVYGSCAWKLIYGHIPGGIKILRAQTREKHAVLPDEIFGEPVIAIGDHALAPDARPVAGEELEILCGRQDETRTNRDIETLALPKKLESIENYAFYSCSGLKSLDMYGEVKRAGTELFMNCRSFGHFNLYCSEERAPELISFITLELSRELSADIYTPDGGHIALMFPEFIESYEENLCGRNFDLNIQGGGYPYHSNFEHTFFNLAAYDSHWEKYLSKEHDPLCALRLAWNRLRTPAGLGEKAEQTYTDYLKARAGALLEYVILSRDGEGLSFAIEKLKPSPEDIALACGVARQQGDTRALALLLETGHKKEKPAGRMKSFEL